MHKCPIVSAGLRAILSTQPDFQLSAGPPGGCALGRAGVVIADYDYGVSAAHVGPVLALTDQAKAGAIRHALASGVRGYVIQGCDASEVIEGVRTLSRGDSYLSPMAGRAEAEWLNQPPLTQREADVLLVLLRGSPDKTIARKLEIGVGTVKCHMKQLFLKLGVATRTQAVIRAMDLGLDESSLMRMRNQDDAWPGPAAVAAGNAKLALLTQGENPC
jgi:DNA-binding CsgD family transcriptional regulator